MKAKILLLSVILTFIVANASAESWNCGYPNETNVTATLVDGTMTISGSGAMDDFNYPPWNNIKDRIQKVIIEDGITSIGDFAFLDCTSLSDLSMGNTISRIGTGAFFGCNISFVNIPAGVQRIEMKAFAWGAVEYLAIPESVTEIISFAFAGNSELKEISVFWDDPSDIFLCPSDDPFDEIDKKSVILHVPAGTKAIYQNTDNWKEFNIIDDGAIIVPGTHHLTNLTVSAGTLSPAFNPTRHNYRVNVPQSVENIMLTATPSEGATVSGDGSKQPNLGENTYDIVVSASEENTTYTVIVTRAATDYLLEPIRSTEMTTGARTVTYRSPVTNSDVTVAVIDKYELEFVLSTGSFSGDLPLHFEMENGRYTYDKTINVAPNSIYTFTLNLRVTHRQGDITFTTHFDGFGRPSFVTIDYIRHLCNIITSDENVSLSTTEMNMAGSSITDISVSDLTFVGNANFTSTQKLFIDPTITVSPNPASSFITIAGLHTDETLVFYNVDGQAVLTCKTENATETVPVGHLSAGMYLVKTGSGQTFKWIKK